MSNHATYAPQVFLVETVESISARVEQSHDCVFVLATAENIDTVGALDSKSQCKRVDTHVLENKD